MLSDEFSERNIVGPATIGATTFSIHLHVDNANELMQHAVNLGATLLRPATDHFYGERSGTLRDPFGHEWLIGHSIETVTTWSSALHRRLRWIARC
jgi:PhnB protein